MGALGNFRRTLDDSKVDRESKKRALDYSIALLRGGQVHVRELLGVKTSGSSAIQGDSLKSAALLNAGAKHSKFLARKRAEERQKLNEKEGAAGIAVKQSR